ncbi:MAG: CvpA family protein [Maledivibacter sp.]|nr:CvpA family protein [Maledivibacter sp.]
MNWMDISVIIIIVISGLRGLSIGLVLSFFNIASYIVAGIIAKLYYSFVSVLIIENTNWFYRIQQFIIKNMKFLAKDSLQNQGATKENIFEMMNLPKIFEKLFMKSDAFAQYSEGSLYNINIYISELIAKVIIDLLSIIIIFIIARIALNILSTVLNGIASLPIIKQFNRLGGLIFGFIKGVLIVFILAAIMIPIVSISPSCFLANALENSIIAKSYYDHNVLLYMVKSIVTYGGSQMVNSF